MDDLLSELFVFIETKMSDREHEKAKAWRERSGLSIDELAALSGYSALAIRYFEKGITPPRTAHHVAGAAQNRPVPEAVWKRYKNVCCGVFTQKKLGQAFEW